VVRRTTATRRTDVAAVAPVPDPNAPAPPPPRPLPWVRISVAAAAVLVATLGVLTGVEGLLGRPLAAVVGGSDATGTSLGTVDVRPGGSGAHTPATPTQEPTPASPAAQLDPSEAPTTPAAGVPTAEPSGSATAPPTTIPTTGPTTGTTTGPTESAPAPGATPTP
jgi:hypothetical protein